MSRILVTGAAGFVGRALLAALAPRHAVRAAGRGAAPPGLPAGVTWHAIGEIGPQTPWAEALAGVDCVVHLAAHVHVRGGAAERDTFMRVNRDGTRRLAAAARDHGVRRLVFLSTVKVHGEASGARPLREDDPAAPVGPYAASKWAAEQALVELAAAGGPATIILRPPLVYGPGAKANVAALLRLCRSGLPLPFGATRNRRSLLYLGNLADAIRQAVESEAPAGCRAYLLRDGEDLSTGELIRRLAAALERPARLVAVPPGLLAAALRLIGKGAAAQRLLGSLAVDDSRFRADFAWRPPHTTGAGLAATAAAFRAGAAPAAVIASAAGGDTFR